MNPDEQKPMKPYELQEQFAKSWIGVHGDKINEVTSKVRKVRKIFTQLCGNFMGPPSILDVGCADGSVLYPLTNRAAIHGIDISDRFLRVAKSRGYDLCFRQNIDGERLAVASGYYNMAFAGDVLEHVVDTDWLLYQINAALKIKGYLVLSIPNVRTLASLGAMVFYGYPPVGSARYRSGHFRDFTLHTVKLALDNNGFRVTEAIGTDILLPFFGDTLSWLATYLPSWSSQIILVCRKEWSVCYQRTNAVDRDIYNRGDK